MEELGQGGAEMDKGEVLKPRLDMRNRRHRAILPLPRNHLHSPDTGWGQVHKLHVGVNTYPLNH